MDHLVVSPGIDTSIRAGDGRCLARSLADALRAEPALEAVTVCPRSGSLQIATLGNAPQSSIKAAVAAAVLHGTREGRAVGCGLLTGSNDCHSCSHPLDDVSRHHITVDRTPEGTTFARITCPTAPHFWRWKTLRLPRFTQRELRLPVDNGHKDEWKGQLATAVLCGLLGLIAHVWLDGTARMWAYGGAFVAGAWFTLIETWERLRRGTIDVHFLMLAVAGGSAAIGAWGEGAMLLFLFALSGALELYALGRTEREIASLFKESPRSATILDSSGEERALPIDQIRSGMLVTVKPGAQFPVDGTITTGTTAADESNLSGESAPVSKAVGDLALAGTLNLWGAVTMRVLRPAAESALQKIIRLIREAQHSKAPSQRFTDRFGSGYTAIVLGLTAVMFFVWWRVYGYGPFQSASGEVSAFYRAMTLLVVASPCALVLSIPSAILAAIAWAARRGILFRGGAAVEQLAEVNVVALDKTGTVTTGALTVESLETRPPGREQAAWAIAGSLARQSTHPLSRAISAHASRLEVPLLAADHVESVPGQGLSAQIASRLCLLGRREFIEALAPPETRQLLAGLATTHPDGLNRPEVWIASGDFIARIQFRDEIRPEAPQLIRALREAGLATVLLTGDRQANAAALQRVLPLDEVRAELRPEDKLNYIVYRQKSGARIAMVGDGVNDAPSLAAAHVGVGMGARGSDAALEQADVVLMRDRLENFLAALHLSQRARRIIKQNLFISLGTVITLVGFALGGQIPLTLGVLGHEGSTVIVVLNSLRLLFPRPGTPRAAESPRQVV